jgi:lactate permease
MMWTQIYNPLGNIALSALVAGIPLIAILYMLGIRRAPGHHAAMLGTGSAVLLAIIVWGMPVSLAVSSTLLGMLFGIFPICWIVISGVWIYNMTVESGEFEIIKNSLASITDDRRLQALFIAFAFGAFIEGTAGFGTPVAITAAMLTGLGFNPIYAAGICLVANTAPVAFGSIGIPIITAGQVTGLDPMKISQIVGRQLPLLSVLVPLWLVILMGGWKRSVEVLPAVIVAGLSFALTQFFASNYLGPMLPDILSALVCIVSLLLFLRVWKPAQVFHFPDEKPSTITQGTLDYSLGRVIQAWAPYLIMAVMVLLWGLDPVKKVLNGIYMGVFNWPGLHNEVIRAVPIVAKNTPYAAQYIFNFFSAAGTCVLFAGLLAVLVMPNYSHGRAVQCLGKTIKQISFPILTISLVLGLAYIMNYAGMSATLGLAFTSTGHFFPFFAPILGWIGVCLTGSDTSSNALFGNLQKTAAEQLGIDPNLTVAANSTGGVAGKMISPQSISVATAATGWIGHESDIFRFTLKHSVGMCLVIAILTYLQAYTLRWMLP